MSLLLPYRFLRTFFPFISYHFLKFAVSYTTLSISAWFFRFTCVCHALQKKPYVLPFLVFFRSGCFLLQSAKNILTSSRLLECEEALNNGSMIVAEVFVSLRSRSILHLFASTGRFLGLEVIYVVLYPLHPRSSYNIL